MSVVQSLSRVISTRSSMQVLSGILFKKSEKGVELQATDLEMSLCVKVSAVVEGDDSFVMPGRLTLDIVRLLSGEDVEISVDGDLLELNCGGAKYNIKHMPAEDFPKIPVVGDGMKLETGSGDIIETFEWVSKSTSNDETRPILTSVLVEASGDVLRMVATDSYRMSVKETKVDKDMGDGFIANVPSRSLQELARLIPQVGGDDMYVSIGEGQVVFDVGDARMTSRLIEGQFPNYKKLLPEEFEYELKIDRERILDAVRRMGLLAQKNTPLRLAFSEGKLEITARTPDVGEAREEIEVPFSGDGVEIGFNPEYIRDGLESARSDEVVLKMISALRPVLIETVGDESFTCLIMPVRLND